MISLIARNHYDVSTFCWFIVVDADFGCIDRLLRQLQNASKFAFPAHINKKVPWQSRCQKCQLLRRLRGTAAIETSLLGYLPPILSPELRDSLDHYDRNSCTSVLILMMLHATKVICSWSRTALILRFVILSLKPSLYVETYHITTNKS